MIPTDPFIKKLLGSYEALNPEQKQEVVKLSLKMTSFNFIATFIKVEEGPIVRTYYFEPSSASNLSVLLTKEEDLALALAVEVIMVKRELGYITIAVPRNPREVIKFDTCLFEAISSKIFQSLTLPILWG